jgi:adenylylsulfate kinase
METRGSEPSTGRFGLGFSAEDREENIRRIGEVAKLFTDAGLLTLKLHQPLSQGPRCRPSHPRKEQGRRYPVYQVFMNGNRNLRKPRPKGLYKQARAASRLRKENKLPDILT